MNRKQIIGVLLIIIIAGVCGALTLNSNIQNVSGRQTLDSRELSFTYLGERLHIEEPRGAAHYIRYAGHIDDTLIFSTSFSETYVKVGETFGFTYMPGRCYDVYTVIRVSEDYQRVLVRLVVDRS